VKAYLSGGFFVVRKFALVDWPGESAKRELSACIDNLDTVHRNFDEKLTAFAG
jgi:hypothetical protein